MRCRIAWGLTSFLFVFLERGQELDFSSALYHVPAFWPLASFEPAWVSTFWHLGLVGAAMTVLGVASRTGIALVVGGQGLLFLTDLLRFRNHVYLLLVLGVLLLFAPCHGQATQAHDLRTHQPFERAIRGQILVVYVFATLNKCNAAYLSGWVLQAELPNVLPRSLIAVLLPASALDALLQSPTSLALLSCAGVLSEGLIALCLLCRDCDTSAWRSAYCSTRASRSA
jgi:hypothetical protein